MASEWTRVVLERLSEDEYAMYSAKGTDKLDTIPFGLCEDGNPIDESLNAEWGMNFAATFAVTNCPTSCSCHYSCKRTSSLTCTRLSALFASVDADQQDLGKDGEPKSNDMAPAAAATSEKPPGEGLGYGDGFGDGEGNAKTDEEKKGASKGEAKALGVVWKPAVGDRILFQGVEACVWSVRKNVGF
eukprot:6212759-Pleurochrysis_carterae.AAC.4